MFEGLRAHLFTTVVSYVTVTRTLSRVVDLLEAYILNNRKSDRPEMFLHPFTIEHVELWATLRTALQSSPRLLSTPSGGLYF
jgi:hypothetical protein